MFAHINLLIFRAVSIIPQPQVDEKAQFLDEHVLFADTIEFTEEQPSPRFIKSHLPVSLLPKQIWTKKPKVCMSFGQNGVDF